MELAIVQAQQSPRTDYMLAIVLAATGAVLGACGLVIRNWQSRHGEIAYLLPPDSWGRGYATELVRAMPQHGFSTLALPAIGAFVRPANVASVRVLEKCGFTLLGYEPRLERNRYEVRRSVWLSTAEQADGGRHIGT